MEHRVSNAQMDAMLEYLSNHPGLVKGVGLGARSKEAIDRQWNDLASSLNSYGFGATKSGQRWKRYWIDLKHKVKTRAAAKKKEISGTGGGPPSESDFSEIDKKVLAIIGEGAVYGDSQYSVPAFTTPTFSTAPAPSSHSAESCSKTRGCEVLTSDVLESVSSPTKAVCSPSTHGQTDTYYTTEEISRTTKVAAQMSPDILLESPVRRCTKRYTGTPTRTQRRIIKSGNRCDQTKIDPAWLKELEERRIGVEEKFAEAALLMAKAANTQAEAAAVQANAARIQAEAFSKLINK